jgi:hypothetical protein
LQYRWCQHLAQAQASRRLEEPRHPAKPQRSRLGDRPQAPPSAPRCPAPCRRQAGRFDTPDRLFHTVADSWESVLSSSTDVKELTPEFYLPTADFLVNRQQLPLGVRQTGEEEWAGGAGLGGAHGLALGRQRAGAAGR